GIPYEQLFKENSNILNKYFPDLEIIIKEGYRIYKLKEKKLDFDDLVSIYLNAQRNSEDWAFLAKKEIKRIIVDEFQDTDLEQLEWLKLLSPEKLTVVGDDWQAIYSFRGATIEPFLNFPKYFPDTEILYLTTNYRSLHDIIEVSKTPILKNANNIQKITKSYRKEKAGIFKFYLNKEKDWNDFLVIFERENLIKYNPYILSRTNYRLQQLKKLGFPEDRLITIHKSKGLEFETVILDLFDGWSKNDSGDDIDYEEERRILYVGLSRAMNNLILIGNKSKSKKCPEGEFFYYFKKSIKEFPPGDFYKNLNKLNSI
ncbi:MAG: UvrD-helicase domain-containing protein, partial [Leptospiraceae bacterium]|nr:UvrD-helicase domain-containing protein [Leptospiraceae bacterium]